MWKHRSLKIEHEHKQRTKCCNLQHFALSDGKNPRKYHSFSPRKRIRHCYLQGFVHVTIFDFLKNVQIPAFFAFIKAKHRFKKRKQCCNLQGFGTITGKKAPFQRPRVAKTPLFTVFRAFHVFLTFQKLCKYQHVLQSTCQKCCNLQCFFALPSKTLVFAVFCASLVQKVLVFTTLSLFLHGSRKRH